MKYFKGELGMNNLGYYNGEIDLIENMKIPMLDRCIYFGDGVYEATFAVNHIIFALEEHVERIYNNANLLKINIPYRKEEIKTILSDLAKKVDSDKQFVYWQITRGTALRTHAYPKDIKGNLLVYITPLNFIGMKDEKIKLITLEDTRFFHCNIKTINLLPNVMASQAAEELWCEEAILHRGDRVTEGSHSNVHIIKNGVLKTAPTDNLILPGITRRHVIDICNNNNIPVSEKVFTVKELMDADEILITSSTKLVRAAKEVDGTTVGGNAPEIVKVIKEEYMKKILRETS